MRGIRVIVLAGLLGTSFAAQAETLNFSFALSGAFSGSGNFTVATSPGQTVYNLSNGLGPVIGHLDAAGFNAVSATVSVVSGQITGMTGYAYQVGQAGGSDGFNLGVLNFAGTDFEADYTYPNPSGSLSPVNHFASEDGTMTFVTVLPESASATTPEPPSVALFGTGLLGVIAAVRRRLL